MAREHASKGDPLSFLQEELGAMERLSRRRTEPDGDPDPALVSLCSNDYLGLARRPLSGAVSGGAGASALVVGYREVHRAAERALSTWLGAPAALLFTSGYAANVGALSALAGRGDVIVSDALNHASIIDGCRLSGAEVVVVPHLDVARARSALVAAGSARRRFLVTESCFSMDGDGPDLGALRELADTYDAALVVDEAHALGVLGPEGRGRLASAGLRADVLIGTLGKSLGLQGAFVAGSQALRSFLWNRARSFVFSTALSPALAAEVPRRVDLARVADADRSLILARSERVREALGEAGAPGEGPVVAWVLGTEERALRGAGALRERGFLVQAIRPPTVPVGTCRLRITLDAALPDDDFERFLGALNAVRRELGG